MTPWIQTLGGLGLFLFGMATMTSGLRRLSGDRLRGWLARSTRSPLTGVLTGAGVTAIIQSSSATTVAAVGFVGAGLLTFGESLGIIFGANIGTTITGWMVAVLGFKLKLAEAAMPLLFVAGLANLFRSKPRLQGAGSALAGFCLLFIGISYLQDGLAGFESHIDLSDWGTVSVGGRLLLVGVGVVLTLVTQSSSATVATALTAVNASMIDLPQALAVIIGADIGTTATTALATIGGTTASRRTGFAHVIYNVLTGIAAFLLLPLYLQAVSRWMGPMVEGSPEAMAVLFHTLFNVLGVVLILPFTAPFGRLIERLFPEDAAPLAAVFDRRLQTDPHAATAALEFGARQLAAVVLRETASTLTVGPSPVGRHAEALEDWAAAIEAGRDFATGIGGSQMNPEDAARVFAALHALDHIERLVERLSGMPSSAEAWQDEALTEKRERVAQGIKKLATALTSTGGSHEEPTAAVMAVANALEQDKVGYRRGMIERAATGRLNSRQLDQALDGHRWIRRLAYHAGRIGHYLREEEATENPDSAGTAA